MSTNTLLGIGERQSRWGQTEPSEKAPPEKRASKWGQQPPWNQSSQEQEEMDTSQAGQGWGKEGQGYNRKDEYSQQGWNQGQGRAGQGQDQRGQGYGQDPYSKQGKIFSNSWHPPP